LDFQCDKEMADAIEEEASTTTAHNFADRYFSKFPVDSRFNRVKYEKISPATGLSMNTTKIDFVLSKRDPPQVYQIADTLMEATVVIVKKSDHLSLPDVERFVAPVNNCLSSLFETVVMQIGTNRISLAPENYSFKCYLADTLTYGSEVKSATLEAQGFSADTAGTMEPNSTTNYGFLLRNTMFRIDNQRTSAYRPEGACFLGKLHHELSSVNKSLPPNTRVNFQLFRSSNNFYLMKEEDDPTEYEALLSSIHLYVPVAWLQMEMLRELDARWPREPVTYHYRRFQVLSRSIGFNKQEYVSDNLYPESDNPIRLFLMIGEAKAIVGNQSKNPYNFSRKWTVKFNKKNNVSIPEQLETHQIKDQLNCIQQLITDMFQKQQELSERVSRAEEPPEAVAGASDSSVKGKGKGKSSQPAAQQPLAPPPVSPVAVPTSTLGSISRFLRSTVSRRPSQEEEEFDIIPDEPTVRTDGRASIRGPSSSHGLRSGPASIRDGPEPDPDPKLNTFWVTRVQLDLNSEPVV